MRIVTAALALVLVSGQSLAYEAGDWVMRAGLGGQINDWNGETVGGAEVSYSAHVRPALGLTYMVLDDWGIGTRAIWTHGQNLYLGDDGSRRLGSVRATPLSVAVEYYLPKLSQARIWLATGWQFMVMSGEEYRSGAVSGFNRMKVEGNSGAMVGMGVDWDTGSAWSLSASLTASMAKADVTLTGPGVESDYETEPDLLTWQVGLSRRF